MHPVQIQTAAWIHGDADPSQAWDCVHGHLYNISEVSIHSASVYQ